MIPFSSVASADRAVYAPILSAAERYGCENSFVNIFAWLSDYGGAAIVRNFVCVRCLDGYLYPIGTGDVLPVLRCLLQDAAERGNPLRLYCVTPDECSELDRVMPDAFTYAPSRGDFDYLYPVEQLATLAGKKMQAKRNHCNRFEANYDYEILPMTAKDVPECLAFCERWYAERADAELAHEHQSLVKVLRCFDELQLKGLRLTVDGTLAAFTAGSRLNDAVFDVHYEKAIADYDGVYSMINRAFARWIAEYEPTVKWINREDDLNIEGLRTAKLSYHPTLLEKYTATVKESIR